MSPVSRVTAGILALTLLAAGAALDKRSTIEAQNDLLRAELSLASTTQALGAAEIDLVEAATADLEARHSVLVEVAAAREPFLEAVAGFAAQVDRAAEATAQAGADAEAIDVSAQRERVLAAQETVVAERADPSTVERAMREVRAAEADLAGSIDAWQAEQQRRAEAEAAALRQRSAVAVGGSGRSGGQVSAPASTGGGSGAGAPAEAAPASGYGTVRAALDAVGGGGVPLEESGSACGLACASSRGVITFRPALANESWGTIMWVMSHELAHIHQFRVWGALQGSGTYAALYGGDIELLANCMATVRGYASTSCSSDQLGFAAGIWSGQVG